MLKSAPVGASRKRYDRNGNIVDREVEQDTKAQMFMARQRPPKEYGDRLHVSAEPADAAFTKAMDELESLTLQEQNAWLKKAETTKPLQLPRNEGEAIEIKK